MSTAFPRLFAQLDVGTMRWRNRIVVWGHGSKLHKGGRLTDGCIANQAARAASPGPGSASASSRPVGKSA